jgi:hypothetical protein
MWETTSSRYQDLQVAFVDPAAKDVSRLLRQGVQAVQNKEDTPTESAQREGRHAGKLLAQSKGEGHLHGEVVQIGCVGETTVSWTQGTDS